MSGEFKPITTQEEFDAVIKGRLAKSEKAIRAEYSDYEELKTRAESWNKQEAAYKQQVEDLTKERDEAVLKRSRILYAHLCGLDPEDADRLNGKTPEEIANDALDWAISIRMRRKPQPAGSHDGGNNYNVAANQDRLALLRRLRKDLPEL